MAQRGSFGRGGVRCDSHRHGVVNKGGHVLPPRAPHVARSRQEAENKRSSFLLARAIKPRRTAASSSRKHQCLETSESQQRGNYASAVVDRAHRTTHASTTTSLLGVANPTDDTEFGGAPRMKIAVDVDEVLGRFVESLNEFYLDTFDEQYEVSDFHEYCFRKVWNCTQDESNDIVHAFFDSRHFSEGIQPIPGAYEALLDLSQHVDLEVVTSRQNAIQAETVNWIEMHFPGIFQEIHFGNHWAKEGKSISKSEICKRIGASCLIDDNPGYALECAEKGIDVLLYDWNLDYPWSKTEEGPTHERIQRVHNWEQAAAAIMSMVESGHN